MFEESMDSSFDDLPFTKGLRREPRGRQGAFSLKPRRESCPVSPGRTAREQVYFQRRFGLKQPGGATVEHGLSYLDLGNTPPRSVPSSHVHSPGMFATPGNPSPSGNLGGSPMDVDPSSPQEASRSTDHHSRHFVDINRNSGLAGWPNEPIEKPVDILTTMGWGDREAQQWAQKSPPPVTTSNETGQHSSEQDPKGLVKTPPRRNTPSKSPKNKVQPKPNIPAGPSKFKKCFRFLCYCNILIITLTVIGVLLLGLTVEMQQKSCVRNQRLNVTAITQTLGRHVYGQHIALEDIPRTLDQFMNDDSKRSLVMSFHGWTGIGKTFVSTIISNHIFTPSVHKIIIPLHFPHDLDDHLYEARIHDWITTNITQCAVTMFIIDEMDKASPGIILGIESAIRQVRDMHLNSSRVLMILLSNTGGAAINRYVFRHLENGYDREKLAGSGLVDGIVNDGAESEWIKLLYGEGLIDNLVPFLPLERVHVQACIDAYVKASPYLRGKKLDMARILDEFTYLPKDNPIFSKTGCRQVNSKVDMMSDAVVKTEL